MPLAFVVHPLDRHANQRGDAAWLARQLASPRARLLQLRGDAARFEAGELLTQMPAPPPEAPIFLGCEDDGTPWFACAALAGDDLRDLRGLAMSEALPPAQLGVLAQARSLLAWHDRHGFCACCGGASVAIEGGHRRRCGVCGTAHFPRTDPVAIMAVRHQGSVLLGRQQGWRPGMYSALAGFLEPGETLEDAARREVFEESGVRVGEVRYVASQPWPFPSSLMVGFVGDALTRDIVLDVKELEDARWFDADEARAMVERTHPGGLFAANPMALAHLLIRTALGLA